jgi:hypothetical protein
LAISAKDLTARKLTFHDAVNLDNKLTDTARRVSWLLLSTYVNSKTLLAWPAAETMAANLKVHQSTIWRSIDLLCRRGYWTKMPGGGRSISNRYRPNLERVASVRGFNPKTLAAVQENPRSGASQTLAAVRGEPLEEPLEEPYDGHAARGAAPEGAARGVPETNNQLARQGGEIDENLRPCLHETFGSTDGSPAREISPERLETIIVRRRDERGSTIRYSDLSDTDRDIADAWLAEHEPPNADT